MAQLPLLEFSSVNYPNFLQQHLRSTSGHRFVKWLVLLFVFLLVVNCFLVQQYYYAAEPSTATLLDATATTAQELSSDQMTEPGGAKTITDQASGYLVMTPGCRIPDLDPFDPEMRRFFGDPKPIVCEAGTQLPLVDSNNSAIFVDQRALPFYYNDTETVDCCWSAFWRKDNEDNDVSFSEDCHRFYKSAYINDEFIRVECQRRNETIYKDYFAFVPRKLHVEETCRRIKKHRSKANKPLTPPQPSILMVGIDAVSRLNLNRQMPKTVAALHEIGAIEMLGYHKVADNTYPNLVPVLSGFSEEELVPECWNSSKATFDACPFLWKNFSAAGYRTIFAEDACSMTTFNYLKRGFREPPTDYYFRPYCVAAESEIGNTHKLNANLCLGTRKNFANLLHYTRKVADEFASDRYFGFFWEASLTHDFLDYPHLGDEAYAEFFGYLTNNSLLKNTALVFMSDHGLRWGSYRQTYQGRLEDSLPFVFLLMPALWRMHNPVAWATLKRNARRLTTPFDLHETLLDILEPQRLKEPNNKIPIERSPGKEIVRGISMFRPIPDYRTCEMAGIPEHWCMCHSSLNVNVTDPVLDKVVKFVILELNRKLNPYPQCAQLELSSIIGAKSWTDRVKHKPEEKVAIVPWTDYTVTFETVPGKAIFEATVRYQNEKSDSSNNMTMAGSISRLNAYGKTSACVDNFHMRLYCYCY